MDTNRAIDDGTVGESERWLCVIAGGMLGLSALRRGGLAGALFGTLAGLLVHRGVTGRDVLAAGLLSEPVDDDLLWGPEDGTDDAADDEPEAADSPSGDED